MPNFKPFATYNTEGDSFTLHFYLGKEIGGAIERCLRCGQTMAGFVGPLGICTGGPDDKCCNETIFPYLNIRTGKGEQGYRDYEVTPAQLAETFQIAAKYLDPNMEPPPDDEWNQTGLSELRRLIIATMVERDTMRQATQVDVPMCAECGFKEPCSCAAFSQQEVN